MLASSKMEAQNSPLLQHHHQLQEEAKRGRLRWWISIIDVEEVKTQFLFSLPMIITNASYYLIPLVSAMFAGHLGDLELAGATLGNSWATVSGFAFMVTLCIYVYIYLLLVLAFFLLTIWLFFRSFLDSLFSSCCCLFF